MSGAYRLLFLASVLIASRSAAMAPSSDKYYHMKHFKSAGTWTRKQFDEAVPLSWYTKLTPDLSDFIRRHHFGDSTHIVCPGYSFAAGNDFQLGVTGTGKEGESPGETVLREVYEELGMQSKLPYDELVHELNGDLHAASLRGVSKWNGWGFALSDMKNNTERPHPPDMAWPENKNNKVFAVVHASEQELDRLFANAPDKRTTTGIVRGLYVQQGEGADRIDGIVAIPIARAKELAEENLPYYWYW